jgi:hypothetical protein
MMKFRRALTPVSRAPWLRLLFGPAALGLLLAQIAYGETRQVAEQAVGERLSAIGIPFVANSGQTDPAVAYYAQTFAGTVFVTRDGRIVYSLPENKTSPPGRRLSAEAGGWSLTERLVGGKAHPNGARGAPSRVSYFLGNDPARWRSDVPTFDSVSLGEVWPGISVELRASGHGMEKVFTVMPGANPSRIHMSVAGAKSLRINSAGALVASTGLGDVAFTRPMAYQERDGARREIAVAYEARGHGYGFRLGSYDPTLPVLIDPLLQATYLGGSGEDVGYSLAVHPASGDVYVAGYTTSTDFPGTAGGAQPANPGGYDAFVARLNASLTTLTQATYLGGSGPDIGFDLAIHPTSGDVYVTGYTNSTNFPGTTGGAQAANGGGNDAFVARLNASLTTLTQATYLGGSGNDDVGVALAVHPASGDVYVLGHTTSRNFPGTAGGAQAAHGGSLYDAFVARLNSALTTLGQATYLGGSLFDFGSALAIHPTSGDVYVVGNAQSTNFPGTAGGAQPAHGGGLYDAFVARLNPALTILGQATYMGGSNTDVTTYSVLAVHPVSGDVYVTGQTNSTNFPGTAGGAQPANAGGDDAFVARLNAALTTLGQATYLGGSLFDFGSALAIHPTSGDVYVVGNAQSTNFPGTAGGAQAANAGGYDAFVARLNSSLTTPTQATYLGGSGNEIGRALAIRPISGDVYVAGETTSTDFPGTAGGAQPANGGGSSDAFVARLTSDLAFDSCLNVTCTASDQCHDAGVCDPTTGDCSNPAKADGSSCTDGNACTTGDACGAGSCQPGTGTVNVDDGNVCTTDSCDPTSGAIHTPGNAGTTCRALAGECDEAESCTGSSAACPTDGFKASGTACTDDGDACSNDICDGTMAACTHVVDTHCAGCVGNAPPVVTGTAATDPMTISGGNADVSATFTDAPGQTHTCSISWGDGSPDTPGTVSETNGSGTCTGSHSYAAQTTPVVYEVTITVTDDCGGAGSGVTYVVLYDPNGGFVTGGGWINSPPLAYLYDPAAVGKANFGFVSKYKKGSTVPEGNTNFHFNAVGFKFESDTYEWLVISGPKARYRGTGSVNGVAGYGFELTAWDGQVNGSGVDRFRIKIWQGNPGNVIYDNERGNPDGADPVTALGGGSIVIHKK